MSLATVLYAGSWLLSLHHIWKDKHHSLSTELHLQELIISACSRDLERWTLLTTSVKSLKYFVQNTYDRYSVYDDSNMSPVRYSVTDLSFRHCQTHSFVSSATQPGFLVMFPQVSLSMCVSCFPHSSQLWKCHPACPRSR